MRRLNMTRREVIPSVALLLFVAGNVPTFFGSTSDRIFALYLWMIAAITVGIGLGIAYTYKQRLRVERLHRLVHRLDEHMPVEMHFLGVDNDERRFAITKKNGEVVTASVPADYHPDQDNAELLMRAAVGDAVWDEAFGNSDVSRFKVDMGPDNSDDITDE